MKNVFFFILMILSMGTCCMAGDEPVPVFIANTNLTTEQKVEREKWLHELKDEKTRPEAEKKSRLAVKQWFDSLKTLSVHGQVVDSLGSPVDCARVNVHWQEYNLGSFSSKIIAKWIETEKDGSFVVKIDKGGEPHFFEVEKQGYEFSKDFSPYFAKDQTGPGNPLLSTTKEHPVVLVLRKKGGTTLLMENKDVDFQFLVGESGKVKGHDFVQEHRIKNVEKPVLNGETLVCDLQVQATFDAGNSTWTVVLKPGTSGGGIMATDTLLFEAPQDGYKPEVSFVAEDRKMPKGNHIYLKSRDATIYTRLDIAYVIANEKFFRIGVKAVTNPYGDRNLEGEADVPYEVTRKLTDEAKAAHRQGKRPEKHDLQKLIKEVKDKAGKDKPNP